MDVMTFAWVVMDSAERDDGTGPRFHAEWVYERDGETRSESADFRELPQALDWSDRRSRTVVLFLAEGAFSIGRESVPGIPALDVEHRPPSPPASLRGSPVHIYQATLPRDPLETFTCRWLSFDSQEVEDLDDLVTIELERATFSGPGAALTWAGVRTRSVVIEVGVMGRVRFDAGEVPPPGPPLPRWPK